MLRFSEREFCLVYLIIALKEKMCGCSCDDRRQLFVPGYNVGMIVVAPLCVLVILMILEIVAYSKSGTVPSTFDLFRMALIPLVMAGVALGFANLCHVRDPEAEPARGALLA